MVEEKKSERRYLLIFGCSQRKRFDLGLLPGLERFKVYIVASALLFCLDK